MDFLDTETGQTSEYNSDFSIDDILAEFSDDLPSHEAIWQEDAKELGYDAKQFSPKRTIDDGDDDDDVRIYSSKTPSSDYIDLRQRGTARSVEPEFDRRYIMGGQRANNGEVMYGGKRVSLAPDEDYVPPKAPDSARELWPDSTAEAADDNGKDGILPAKARKILSRYKKNHPEEEPVQQSDYSGDPSEYAPVRNYAPEENEEDTEPEISHREKGKKRHYRDFEAEEQSFDEDRSFPRSFGAYITTLLTSILYRFRAGRNSTLTMDDNDEELGAELKPADASRYYGSFTRTLRIRVRIAIFLLIIMSYVSLGLPVTGMLNDVSVVAALALANQFTIMLLAADVVANAVHRGFSGRPGADTLCVLSCIITSIDAASVLFIDVVSPHVPLCALSSLSLVGAMLASLFSAKGLRKSLRVPAIAKRSYTVTGETGAGPGEITLLKSVRPVAGFVHRSEEAAPDEALFEKLFLPLLLLTLALAIILAAIKSSLNDFLFIFSALLAPAVPVTALLCFALPFFTGSVRIFSSGAAIAGWSGLLDIGQSRNLIVTDRDIFPEGSVEMENIRVFADEDMKKIVAYAGTMIAASGSCIAPAFSALMAENHCQMLHVEDFQYLTAGGMQGVIDGNVVLCGNSDVMRLMNVKVPFRLVGESTVLLAINGILFGIFNLKYTALPKVRAALVELMQSNRHPIFAIRDFNVTPTMLHNCFDIATDGYDFPSYVERFRLSSAEPTQDSKVAGVVCREGLGPLTHMADIGRKMYLSVRANMLVTVLSSALGLSSAFVKLVTTGSISLGYLLVWMLLWSLPVLVISVAAK